MNNIQKIWVIRHYIGLADPKWIEYYKKECSEPNSFADTNGVIKDSDCAYIETYLFYNKKDALSFVNELAYLYSEEDWNNLLVSIDGTNVEEDGAKQIIWVDSDLVTNMFDIFERSIY